MTVTNSFNNPATKYGAAFLLSAVALLITYLFWSILQMSPFLILIAAVAISAWLGGLGPGLFSTTLSVLGLNYFLTDPYYALQFDSANILTFIIFGCLAFLISWLTDSQLKAQNALKETTNEFQTLLVERTQLLRQIESERRESKMILNTLPGLIYEGVGSTDAAEQNMRFVSNYSRKLLGYSPDEWYEDPDFWEKITHPKDWAKAVKNANISYDTDESEPVRFRCYHQNGELLHLEAYNGAITDENGNRIRQCGMLIDVTEREHNRRSLLTSANQLKRSNKELEQFAYVASHDLQEPLRMVSSYLQLIEKRYHDKLDEDAREFIGFAVDGANRMKALINDLLLYSRVQRAEGEKKDVDLNLVLAQVVRNLSISIEENDAKIDYKNLPTVFGNERQLEQLFQNLISNAIKFKGEEAPLVRVEAQQKDDQWEFGIVDNGIGINPQFQERIFNIFQRLHTRDEYAGTGIGLAICQKIVDKHDGRIWVESDGKSGTAFRFELAVPEKD